MKKKSITSTPENTQDFNANAIIQKKRDHQKLTATEIKWFIDGLTAGTVADYQMSALLMAIYLNGFDKEETAALTDAMLYSGKVLKFNDPTVVDKHSTGGVGDKASFILAPIAAACGVKVPMIAGRGLGHTGGTVDKVEAIKGFKTSLNLDQFSDLLKKNGQVLIGQTKDIAPADRKIYALRDVTGTVESIPLITASIMSKKLAEGAEGIVMDIKVGTGAFMPSISRARALAKSLRDTATRFDKKMLTMITDMNQPLGDAIGNSLEIIECVDVLKNKGPKDITDISVELAGAMVYLAGLAKTHKAGNRKAKAALKDGSALKKFEELISAQGGDTSFIKDYSKLPVANCITEIKATKPGYIKSMNSKNLGLHSVSLGGGRMKASDKIDFAVGMVMNKNVAQKVKVGDVLLKVYHHKNQESLVQKITEQVLKTDIKITAVKPAKVKPLIYEIHENPLC